MEMPALAAGGWAFYDTQPLNSELVLPFSPSNVFSLHQMTLLLIQLFTYLYLM